jgi:HD-GYP domain-containing protein (c-di-GMP phosphodiesterase class II)
MIKRSIMLEDFLDLENHFVEFINRTALFKTVKQAQFIVYNENYNEITYTYKYNCTDYFEMSDIKKIIKTGEVIKDEENIHIVLCKDDNNCDDNRYMINIINTSSEKRFILGTLFICRNEYLTFNDSTVFNIHYYQQLIFHIQSVIKNYDKLYHFIDIFTELIVAKDQFMPYHMTNVAHICIQLSSYLNLSAKQQMILYYSALLHDIGKLFISDLILNKPTELTEEEYARIKSHSNKGAEIIMATLHGMSILDEIPQIV